MERRQELLPLKKEFDQADKEIKERVKGRPLVIADEITIRHYADWITVMISTIYDQKGYTTKMSTPFRGDTLLEAWLRAYKERMCQKDNETEEPKEPLNLEG